MLAAFLQGVLNVLGQIVSAAVALLPPSPFVSMTSGGWGEWAGVIGYWLPVDVIVGHSVMILGACAIWYGVRAVLRLARQVG